MKQLQNELDLLLKQSGVDDQIIEVIKREKSVFPFSTEGVCLHIYYLQELLIMRNIWNCKIHMQNEINI